MKTVRTIWGIEESSSSYTDSALKEQHFDSNCDYMQSQSLQRNSFFDDMEYVSCLSGTDLQTKLE
jgi:hypothetical protein